MKKITLLDINGTSKSTISVPESIFVEKPHKQAIFDSIIC